ncbi:hypothetical protein Tco_0860356 [Tanacetum coccineum]|uniref:Uncharacterized protein n=1 Tax=Tanacetum coccineum TaxID=301880 RepID=A0ABQ5BKF4_9ASTR
MADENVPAPAPTRSDDQILPFAAWMPIGKSNHVLDLQKRQKNPIFQIAMDILQNTNFFRAFTASASLDENWFTLDANLLREALEITHIDQAHPFVSPPSGDAIMDFVNELGKTSGHDRPRYPVLYMLWGIITSTNVDYAELMWEEFIIHNIHQRSASLFHLVEEDLRLGNLKFISKGEVDEVFGMPIPNELISNNIKNTPYYNAYLEMVAKHDQKVAAEKEGKNKSASTKQPKPKPAIKKSSKPAPLPKPKVTKEKPSKASTAKPPKPKPAKENSTKATPLQKADKGKVAKVHTVKSSLQLVDTPDEEPANSKPEPEHQGEGEEFDMGRAIQMSLESFQAQGHARVGGVAIQEPVAEAIQPLPVVEGKGKAIITKEQAAQSLLALHTPKSRSTTDQFIFQRRTPATEEASIGPSAQLQDHASTNIVRDSPSLADAETGVGSDKTNSGGDTEILQINEELGEDVEKQVDLEEKTVELDQDQAGSDPGETHESRPPPEHVLMDEDQAGPDPRISRVALAGPDPEPTHDEFMTDLIWRMHMLLEVEVVSMVTVPIYQASSSVSPLLTSVIDLSPPKPASSTTQAPIFIATTTTTPTTLPPPPQQQSITKSKLAERVTVLEKKLSDLEQNNKNLGSRVYTLELRDLPHKINEAVHENVKEAVQIALQAPFQDRFRDLSEEDMKEMLHQRMFETGSYKSLPEHITLYEALKASIERAQRDEFLAEKDKSRKRRRDDQDPPPPPPDSDLNAPSSSSKQQFGPHAEQPVEDISIQDFDNISDSKDTDSAHLIKTKQRPEWLKPIPDDERPATPDPAWVIPISYIPDVVNNWANALATTYQAPAKNSLLEKTGDMRTFMNWYFQKMGNTELTQADLEGQAYEVVKPFYPDVVHL